MLPNDIRYEDAAKAWDGIIASFSSIAMKMVSFAHHKDYMYGNENMCFVYIKIDDASTAYVQRSAGQ